MLLGVDLQNNPWATHTNNTTIEHSITTTNSLTYKVLKPLYGIINHVSYFRDPGYHEYCWTKKQQ